ncbi:zinc finger protein RFP-like isoform X2 [Hemicordylus capensis]|nr:zinc finger protein RFP-like isoform X2 [Hemicordylus capensis]XP_053147560.1 zinc finger protein RFP-like isoform X2 [Hemicordylus capensis]XP_053147561.1 zinc finger protein RFP-like isoform X2 [Hemicordylus capensis]XP_053147562.1 zinc finger protein RFP-like isoform X2 [Hemicordylus capensis]XP_053147563.1 zinc finger protein RFP-like isoform X2 [Hemicordylus capensis]
MAAPSPRKKLKEEVTCSICLDFFADPVMLDCGHNFCRACIIKCLGESATNSTTCPQCRERVRATSLKPNRQLANMVEIAKELSVQAMQGVGGARVCERHHEPLKLFCKDDEAPICVVCDRSKEHRAHNVVPVEEAVEEYRDQICSCLDTLRKERENILTYRANTEKESQGLLKQTAAEKQKTVAEFRQLRQFLEEREKLLLAQIEDVEKEIAKKRDEQMARLSVELSSLQDLIQEMEEKHQQSASQLLQGIGSILQRWEEKEAFENPETFPPALKWRIWELCDINPFLKVVMKKFKDTLRSGFQLWEANVILDPVTAHPKLILAEDRRSVRMGEKWQDLPARCERFDYWPFVLGYGGFAAGRHFWEVTVGSEEEWAVGVARKSVKRKGQILLSPEEGLWAVGLWAGKYRAFHHPRYPPLSFSGELKRIRVSLNCAGGQVAFYDADTATLLHKFSRISIHGEILYPLVWVSKKSHLKFS